MNYCTNCGNKIDNNADVCLSCGIKLKKENNRVVANDNGGFAWSLLGFFVPMVGLILYLVWKNERPKTAKALGKGALAYVIFYIIMIIITFLFLLLFRFQTESGVANIDYNDNYNENYYKFE